MRLLQEREEERAVRLKSLRHDIQAGLEELDHGEGVDGEEAFDRVLARINEHEESARGSL